MSAYLGDFLDGVTIKKMWNTNAVAGESITRATNGTVSVYKDGGTTQSTTGVTDTEDFDSLTGVHLCAIDTSADATFYSPGSDFEAVLSAATIDGKTINATLFSFSLRNRSNATIIDRGTVPAAGSTTGTRLRAALSYADDILNGGILSFVGGTGKGQSTSVIDYALTNDQTTHPTIATAASTDTLYELLPYGLVAPTASSPAPVNVVQISDDATAANNAESFFDGTGYAGTNNVIPTVTTLTNAPSDSSGVTTLLSRLTSTRAGYLDNLSAGAVSTAAALATVDTNVSTLLTRLTATRAGYMDNLGAALTESYATDGAAPTLPQFMFMLWARLAENSVSGSTMTAKKLDGSATAMTFTLNDPTSPTSITRAS